MNKAALAANHVEAICDKLNDTSSEADAEAAEADEARSAAASRAAELFQEIAGVQKHQCRRAWVECLKKYENKVVID